MLMQYRIQKNSGPHAQAGFTIVEILVCIVIIGIAMVPAINAMSSILPAAKNARDSITASFLLREAIDLTRNLRDTDALTHLTDPNHAFGCFGNCANVPIPSPPMPIAVDGYYWVNWDSTSLNKILSKTDPIIKLKQDVNGMYYHASLGGTNTIFSRVIGIKTMPQGIGSKPITVEFRVIATVSWDENGVSKNIVGEEHLFNFFESP